MNIYLGGSISGLSGEEVFNQIDDLRIPLEDLGYNVYHPMIGKEFMALEEEFIPEGYTQNPVLTDSAIFNRDRWMISHCDVIVFNLLNAKSVSIGSMFEMAWAYDEHKMIITLMKDNIHNHCFVKQSSSIIYEDEESAITYLKKLNIKGN